MFKSIKKLAVVYFRENGLRDAIILIVFVIFISIYYMLFAVGYIEFPRKQIVWVWIVLVAGYTLFTAFDGYGDLRRIYMKLLLPTSILAKFVWEWFRTLILFGGATIGLLFAIDTLFDHYVLEHVTGNISEMVSSRSLKEILLVRFEPLNYLPIFVYILVLWHSVAILVRALPNKFLSKLLIVAAWVLIFFLPINNGRSLLYPFISQHEQWSFLRIQLSWCPRSIEYLLSYIWLGTLPIALYVLSYFKIKESEI